MKKFTTFRIYSTPFQPDLITGLLWELDISGINEEDDHLIVYAIEDAKVHKKAVIDLLYKLKTQNVIESYTVNSEVTEDKNWNEIWEKSREVIRVSDRIVIKPTFKSYEPKQNEIVITIDPKMSFGTGEHQTTKLVIQLLEKYIKPGTKLLDVGSGTGILSIAAIKLGASHAVAVDNDEVCFENCLENSKLNDVENNIEILTGSINDVNKDDFDIVVANIQKNVLTDIAAEIYKKVKSSGNVILSGLLDKDESDVIQKFTSVGFKLKETAVMDEWIAVVFKNK